MSSRPVFKLSQAFPPSQNNQFHTDPAGSARAVGSQTINNVTVTLSGSTLMIESAEGWVNLQLTPQQVQQVKSEFNDLFPQQEAAAPSSSPPAAF